LNYVLTKDAEADLRGIVRYTSKEWGAVQVRTYIAKLKAGIARVAAGQGAFKELDALYPALRMARCQHHFVFCLPREDAPALIVAIFHERMDLMVRLATRLND
jgi:plasmid stabilization system protein ParE